MQREIVLLSHFQFGFPGGSNRKESACNAGDVGALGGKDPLEKEMATCSSSLAWRIPWTEELGGLQSMGSQRVDMTEQLTLSLSFQFLEGDAALCY